MKTWYGYYIEKIVDCTKEDFFNDYKEIKEVKLQGDDVFSEIEDGIYEVDNELIMKEVDTLYIPHKNTFMMNYEEVKAFEADLITPLIFEDGSTTLKTFFGKTYTIERGVEEDDYVDFRLLFNSEYEIDIVQGADGDFSAYDGVNGYGWYPTVKKAIKSYLEYNLINRTGENECSTCRGGGCIHCEPQRFVDFHIGY